MFNRKLVPRGGMEQILLFRKPVLVGIVRGPLGIVMK